MDLTNFEKKNPQKNLKIFGTSKKILKKSLDQISFLKNSDFYFLFLEPSNKLKKYFWIKGFRKKIKKSKIEKYFWTKRLFKKNFLVILQGHQIVASECYNKNTLKHCIKMLLIKSSVILTSDNLHDVCPSFELPSTIRMTCKNNTIIVFGMK